MFHVAQANLPAAGSSVLRRDPAYCIFQPLGETCFQIFGTAAVVVAVRCSSCRAVFSYLSDSLGNSFVQSFSTLMELEG